MSPTASTFSNSGYCTLALIPAISPASIFVNPKHFLPYIAASATKRKEMKRKQYRGLCLNPISAPHAHTHVCEVWRLERICMFCKTGEAAKEIVANCINLDSRPVRIRWLSRLKAYRHDAFCRRARIRRTLMRERPLRCRAKVRYGSPSRHGISLPHSIQEV